MSDTALRPATARTWAGLLVLLVPALLTSMDVSVLFVAGPTITEQLRLSPTQWLWAMDLYGFVMAGLLITMGSLGDRYGRRRLLLVGGLTFGIASTMIAFAPTGDLLIAGRAVLAVGGATLAPSTLSLIRELFEQERQRRLALGAWTATFAGGAVCGPIIAGLLLDHFWWGSVFLLNVPAMIALLCLAPVLVPESRVRTRARLDVVGTGTSLLAVLGLVFALKEITLHGPGWVAIGAALLGLASTVLFLVWQRRASDPLIDLRLFRSRPFVVGFVATVVVAAVTGGLGVLVFPYLQTVHGLTPFWSAVCGLPCLAGSFLGAAAAARLARHVASRHLISVGLSCCAVGLMISGVTAGAPSFIAFLAGYTILIMGCGLTATVAISLVIGRAPVARAGAVAGLSESSSQLGTAVGIAVFGVLATALYRKSMDQGIAVLGSRSLADTILVAQSLPAPAARALLERAHAGYVAGLAGVSIAAAIMTCVLGAWLAVAFRFSDRSED